MTGSALESARLLESAKSLTNAGAVEMPLKAVGRFLCDIGGIVCKELSRHPSCRVLFNTEARELVQLGTADDPLWKIKIKTVSKGAVDGVGAKLLSFSYLFSKTVVLATGGVQLCPSLPVANHNSKVMGSDYLCTAPGIKELEERLKRSGRRKVVIVGGSHSGFSAAWVCLNLVRSGEGSDGTGTNSGFAPASICLVHKSPIKVFYVTKKDAEADGYKDPYRVNKKGQVNPFGGLRGNAKVNLRLHFHTNHIGLPIPQGGLTNLAHMGALHYIHVMFC